VWRSASRSASACRTTMWTTSIRCTTCGWSRARRCAGDAASLRLPPKKAIILVFLNYCAFVELAQFVFDLVDIYFVNTFTCFQNSKVMGLWEPKPVLGLTFYVDRIYMSRY
jgi:hypothetical protein